MKTPKETPPAGTEGAEENHVESEELSSAASGVHGAIRSQPSFPLKRPPGLVGDIADYIYASAPRQMIEAAVLAGLGLVAGIAGRHYNVNGSGLNIYLMLLAGTGRGKNAMAKGIRRLITGAERNGVPMAGDFLGPDSFTAGSSLHRFVIDHLSVLLLFGEYGQQLKAMTDRRAHPNEIQLMRLILALYSNSGAGDFLPARVYSDKEKTIPAVQSPAISILCESQAETIYSNLSHEQIANGLLPRFLILECPPGNRPPLNPGMNKPPPQELISAVANLAASSLAARDLRGETPEFQEIEIETSAQQQLDSINLGFDALYNSAEAPAEKELWNRAYENTCRIAGVLAVGINMHRPVITTECVTWAEKFVRYCIGGLLSRFASGEVSTSLEARQDAEMKKYVVEYIRMTADERRKKYGIQKRIVDLLVIPHRYLRHRAMRQSAFTDDRRGFNAALNATISALIKDGVLYRMTEDNIRVEYGLNCVLYGITSPNVTYAKRGVGYAREDDSEAFAMGLGLKKPK